MEIIREMDVSDESFFKVLIDSVRYDVEKSTQKKIVTLEEGFSYEKKLTNKLGQKGIVKVKIDSLEIPQRYCASFAYDKGTNFIEYFVESLGKEKIRITYTEAYKPNGNLNKINHSIVSRFYKKKNTKKIKNLLNEIEKYLLDKKNS